MKHYHNFHGKTDEKKSHYQGNANNLIKLRNARFIYLSHISVRALAVTVTSDKAGSTFKATVLYGDRGCQFRGHCVKDTILVVNIC